MRVRARVLVAFAVLLTAAACAGPEPSPSPKPDLKPDVAPIDTSGGLEYELPPAPGGGDVVLEEKDEGPLKGYLTRFYRIRHVQGTQLVGLLQNWKSPGGRILDVPSHNLLIITETKERSPVLLKVLEQIDRVPPQVEIEAKVIELRRSNNYEFGWEMHVNRAPSSNTAFRKFDGTFNSPSFLDSLRPNATPYQGAQFNWAAVGKAVQVLGDFDYIVRALEKDGYAEVLSAPRIVVHSGKPATLRAMTKVPIQTTNIVPGNFQQITTTFEQVGVTLVVTPVVVGTDAILLDAQPTVSSIVQQIPSGTVGPPIPVIAERSANTQVDIRDGEILVIGGLLERRLRHDTTRLPILGYIPFLGKAFQSIDDEETKTEVIIVLRLNILTALGRAKRALEDVPDIGREERRPK